MLVQTPSYHTHVHSPTHIQSTTVGGRAFSYRAPLLWNNLPASIREPDTLPIFKSRLKAFLFSLDVNIGRVSASRMEAGRLFQRRGARELKALPPTVVFDILGITRRPALWERSGLGGQ